MCEVELQILVDDSWLVIWPRTGFAAAADGLQCCTDPGAVELTQENSTLVLCYLRSILLLFKLNFVSATVDWLPGPATATDIVLLLHLPGTVPLTEKNKSCHPHKMCQSTKRGGRGWVDGVQYCTL